MLRQMFSKFSQIHPIPPDLRVDISQLTKNREVERFLDAVFDSKSFDINSTGEDGATLFYLCCREGSTK